MLSSYLILCLLLSITAIFVLACLSFTSFAQVVDEEIESVDIPSINDPDLKVITVVEGLKRPTSMAFLGPDDFLVLEKNSGIVKRIISGSILKSPVLDAAVANEKERGLLGVAIQSNNSDLNDDDNYSKEVNNTSVFLVLHRIIWT